jgi:hypothetical protein
VLHRVVQVVHIAHQLLVLAAVAIVLVVVVIVQAEVVRQVVAHLRLVEVAVDADKITLFLIHFSFLLVLCSLFLNLKKLI